MGIEWAEDSPAQRAQIQTLYEVQRVINPSPAASVVPAQTAHSRSAARVQSIKGLRGFSERSCKAAVKYCEKGHSALLFQRWENMRLEGKPRLLWQEQDLQTGS